MKPLLAAAALAAAAVPTASAQLASAQLAPAPVVTVSLSSYAIAPNPLLLAARKPVTLRFVNLSGKGHDFTAPAFFAAAAITAGAVVRGSVQVPAHATREVTLVPAPGIYPVKCAHFLHAAFGMRGQIRVG